ncbi:hypothetical protein [Streptomyces gobiensis]|uniref:hypothetical protein n=1 Tax=Streptomyces gobiensis TaxID=2875706 RepID=UPI001E568E52|nr:hypothetical protein [Streptomyces gobiensis]UGY90274.1 hypothetical protein test1122_00040 [Streptomyces gobiensis]UGY94937.1 hypothetical protein test1122_26500 [Streptomyces gobiensis]
MRVRKQPFEAVEIKTLLGSRVREAAAVMARALHDDPVYTHIFPRADERARALPLLYALVLRDTLPRGAVHVTLMEKAIVGVAAWLPPRCFPLNAARRLRCVPAILPVLLSAPRSLPALTWLEAALAQGCPPEPMWYWQVIGVDPHLSGSGVGYRLVRAGLELVDREALPCHAETSTEHTARWAQRLGFEVAPPCYPVDDGHPALWKLMRPSQAAPQGVDGGSGERERMRLPRQGVLRRPPLPAEGAPLPDPTAER